MKSPKSSSPRGSSCSRFTLGCFDVEAAGEAVAFLLVPFDILKGVEQLTYLCLTGSNLKHFRRHDSAVPSFAFLPAVVVGVDCVQADDAEFLGDFDEALELLAGDVDLAAVDELQQVLHLGRLHVLHKDHRVLVSATNIYGGFKVFG